MKLLEEHSRWNAIFVPVPVLELGNLQTLLVVELGNLQTLLVDNAFCQ